MRLVRQDPGRYDQTLEQLPVTFQTRDGHTLYSRLVHPSDAARLLEFFERLSSDTRRRRFHTDVDHLDEERKQEIAHALASVDNRTTGGAVLAIDRDVDGDEHIVGVARLARPFGAEDSTVVEAAVVVRDDFQGRGVGTELVFRMVLLAKLMQADTLLAEFEPTNDDAIRIFRELNLPTEISASGGETTLYISLINA